MKSTDTYFDHSSVLLPLIVAALLCASGCHIQANKGKPNASDIFGAADATSAPARGSASYFYVHVEHRDGALQYSINGREPVLIGELLRVCSRVLEVDSQMFMYLSVRDEVTMADTMSLLRQLQACGWKHIGLNGLLDGWLTSDRTDASNLIDTSDDSMH